MPGWVAIERDDEIWAVVAFLRKLPGLDAAEYRELALGGVQASVQSGRDMATDRTGARAAGRLRCRISSRVPLFSPNDQAAAPAQAASMMAGIELQTTANMAADPSMIDHRQQAQQRRTQPSSQSHAAVRASAPSATRSHVRSGAGPSRMAAIARR
jgi:hypothetical protein